MIPVQTAVSRRVDGLEEVRHGDRVGGLLDQAQPMIMSGASFLSPTLLAQPSCPVFPALGSSGIAVWGNVEVDSALA